MKREIIVGNFCQKCEAVMNLHRLDCCCMRDMPEHATKRWRMNYWKPLYWKAEVTMASANRRPRVMLSDSKGPTDAR